MEPATENQIAYIQKLLVDSDDREELSDLAKKLTKWDASTVIDAILEDEWEYAENILRGDQGDDAMNYQLDQARGK